MRRGLQPAKALLRSAQSLHEPHRCYEHEPPEAGPRVAKEFDEEPMNTKLGPPRVPFDEQSLRAAELVRASYQLLLRASSPR